MDFKIIIDDEKCLKGLAWAREQHNATLPVNEKGVVVDELKEDSDYLQFVMKEACKSYCYQKLRKELEDKFKESLG